MVTETTKKCPYCSMTLAINDTECFSCKNKVGPPNEYGIADKPTDWWSYVVAVVLISAFLGFMYWLLFVKGQGGG